MAPKQGARAKTAWGRSAAGLVCLLALGSLPGCAVLTTPSLITVPPAWRHRHPWGPHANAARDEGRLAYWLYTRQMACWAEFGRQRLQDGDILFRMGRSVNPLGSAGSRLIGNATDSPFSHDGIVRRHGDTVWVYDLEAEGIRKLPFEVWMLDVAVDTLAVRRLRSDYCNRIPLVLAYCEEIYQRDVAFDRAFGLGDTEFYCSKLIEKAFRAGGVCLSEPVPIHCLPNYARWRWLVPIGALARGIRADTPIFVPGNECYGTYSSAYLETVSITDKVRRSLIGRRGPVCGVDVSVAP